jgi:hypothetical protein
LFKITFLQLEIASGIALAIPVHWMKDRKKGGGAAAPFFPPSFSVALSLRGLSPKQFLNTRTQL